jgi:hypothetical protein
MRQGTSGFVNVSANGCHLQGVVGSWNDNWSHWTNSNPYTLTIWTLLEALLRHQRPPEYGNHFTKHVGFTWNTLMNPTTSLTHFWSFYNEASNK